MTIINNMKFPRWKTPQSHNKAVFEKPCTKHRSYLKENIFFYEKKKKIYIYIYIYILISKNSIKSAEGRNPSTQEVYKSAPKQSKEKNKKVKSQ
jgi:hypothetical protein